ncbi:MAG: FHA domain-containing protein [Actinomycetes bacterium]|jgi:pSer/pThr/pTyr-binding forkhead associated (FHA) protein
MSVTAEDPKRDVTTTINLSSLKSLSPHVSAIMESLSEEERQVLSKLPLGSAMLLVVSGPARGSRFLLNVGSTRIGRSPDADIFLDDVTVSRKHAVIEHSVGSNYLVKDSGSLNGTYVDGLVSSEKVLGNGSEIHIGKYKLVFFISEKNGLSETLKQKGSL